MKWAAGLVGLALVAEASVARAEPVRILISAGHKVGLAAEKPLKYADNDASRVRDVLVGLGGVKPENAFILTEPTRAQLFAAIERARAVAQKHKSDEVSLVFYFSGHGDRDALHLGDDRVLMSDLSAKLAEIPAGLRIAITDACRTNRDKGFDADEPFAITATSTSQATGQVWLHASSDGEAAQESDELQGALFTHAWLNGLRGAADTNGDARVTLDEAFAFAHAQTLIRSSKSSGVVQKPEAVMNLHELAPVVLTQTTNRLATLSLPQARDAHFLVYTSGGKSVVSELWSSPERRIALALPAGRYVVLARAGGAGKTAQIAIAEGEQRNLEDRDFTSTSLEAIAKKGEAPEEAPPAPRPNELVVGYEAGTDTRTGFVQGPRAGWAYAFGRFAVSLGGGADFSGRTVSDQDERLVTGFGRASFELRFPIGKTTLRAGAGGRAGWLWQTLEPSRGPTQHNGAFVVGPEVLVAARIPFSSALFADVGARGDVLFLEEAGTTRAVTGVTGGAFLGASF